MKRTIAWATAIAGTLDIAYAALLSLAYGRNPANMLRFVGSGPFPAATEMGAVGAMLGLLTHFTLMAIMAAAFVMIARSRPHLLDMPYRAGIVYGLVTYFIMNWIVVPLRFDAPLPTKPAQVASQLFAHIVLVGIPIALIAARRMRRRAFT